MENQNKVYFFSPTLDQKLINFQKDHPDNFIIVDEFNVKTFQEVIKNIKETNPSLKLAGVLQMYPKS